MPNISGSFSGRPSWQTGAAVTDVPNHELSFGEISGAQKSDDAKWNGATVTYWSTVDILNGNGTQRGYFVNDHGADGRDWGTFEGKVTTNGGQTKVEGTWKYSGASGKFSGLTGGGTFRSRVVSASQIDSEWQGSYEIGPTKA